MADKNFKDLHHLTTTDADAFWKRVNQIIKYKKLTQEAVAAMISVNHGTFRNWSHRRIYPDLIDIHHMAQALDTTVLYLVYGKETEPNTQVEYILGKSLLSLAKDIKKAVE